MSDDADIAVPPTDGGEDRVDLAALDEKTSVDPSLFERRADERVFARHVLTTPLHLDVARESRTNLWRAWNGCTTADILTNLEDEYAALRQAAALSDISPLVKYRISGRDAARYLGRLVAGGVRDLPVGEARRVVFCEDGGFVLGDGMLFRLGEEEYRLVTEETHLAWLRDSADGFHVRVEDVTAAVAAMSLQGPLSALVLREAGFDGIETLPPLAARWFDVAGMPVHASRTGMSGDLGYELWIDPDDAPVLWARLFARGAEAGLRAAGFALRELARAEAGHARAGRDYFSAFAAPNPASASTPFELGFSALVDLDAGPFTGRDALRRAKDAPLRHVLAGLVVDFGTPVDFTAIRMDKTDIGLATTTGFSYALGANVALAVLKPAALAASATIHVEPECREGFALRRPRLSVRVVQGPLLSLPAGRLVPASPGSLPASAGQNFGAGAASATE